ncbi:MAG: class I SAM-dependent methyltransferase [Verrucomicrobiota bacterium]|nr:class I SAM-dependent methyltransferase [Verrucomicrobiota bacterium]
MSNTPAFLKARQELDEKQARNRAWWEALPMTYRNWGDANRATTREQVIRDFLEGNPYLTSNHFAMANKDVLEIGCGAGPATCLFADNGARVTAVDLTSKAVEMTTAHEPRATVIEMDAEALSFPDASFDHVFSWGVLHHSAQTERAFAEVARVLRPGGTGLIMVYNRASLRFWLKGLYWLVVKGKIASGDGIASVQRFYTDGYYHRHYTADELTAELSRLGLKITRMAKSHMAKQMIPMTPRGVDEKLKERWGWLLVAEFVKPG